MHAKVIKHGYMSTDYDSEKNAFSNIIKNASPSYQT